MTQSIDHYNSINNSFQVIKPIMRCKLTLLASLVTLSLFAQNTIRNSVSGFAIIKGHIKNHAEDIWDYNQAGYLNNEIISVPVDKEGSFYKKIKVETDAMTVFLYPGRLEIFVQPNDTITINWDNNNVRNTFAVNASRADRNHDMQVLISLDKLYTEAFDNLENPETVNNLTDSAKFSRINQLYNKEIETLLEGEMYVNTAKIATDIYYKFTGLLYDQHLLSKYELNILHPQKKSSWIQVLTAKNAYQMESEEAYRTSSYYRSFILNYIMFEKPIKSYSWMGDQAAGRSKQLPFVPAWHNYYTGLSSFCLSETRDWFITKSIMQDFAYYSFADACAVYNDFMTKVKTPFYADTLKKFYAEIQRLKPGRPAPVFSLKNEKGESVSLSDFKGKAVYIDFWGVGCGPCMYDIKNNVPALHEKYKDKNIVFLNICVDSDTKTWSESLKTLKLNGINLVAEGWTKNPVCRLYNIQDIPHYYLIDASGNFFDTNSPTPGDRIHLYAEIDKLLK